MPDGVDTFVGLTPACCGWPVAVLAAEWFAVGWPAADAAPVLTLPAPALAEAC